ncbi:MAG: hypothetical protein E6J26_00790 [Chloroflexi bacterium]|nr:MAG: hypothetical protein E6J26_00790 [Chloroflexota bacterium]
MLSEPRTLKRLLLGALALFCAWQAQSQLSGGVPSDGVILYAIAVALFLVAFAHQPVAELAQGRWLLERGQAFGVSSRQIVLLALALACTLISLAQFFNSADGTSGGWLLHVASVLLFLAAFVPPGRSFTLLSVRLSRTSIYRVAPLLLVLALGLFARLWQIDHFPFGTWYDEADNGNYAVRMLSDLGFRPVYVESTNLPAHFLYLIALSFKLFGVSTISMRFVTVAFGMVTVAFAYLLFRRWFGESVGLVAAAMFAVIRYDLNFSRIALHGVTTPAFEVVVLYFLDRALERKRPLDFALTGVALGLGLAFYAPFRLFPFALGVFGVGLLLIARRPGRLLDGLRSAVIQPVHLAILGAGVLIAIAPVAEYAWQHPDIFFGRTNQVSIFEHRDEPDLMKALWNNTARHLEMFNLMGDRNGRHNLPNEPMLDPIMGALAVLGFAHALWRWRDPPNMLMLLVIGVMLLGGILTVDFEAPQSLRAIGVMPSLVYFAAIPLAALSGEFLRVFRGANTSGWRVTWAAGLAILLAAMTWSNFDTFFNKQQNSTEVWAAYSAAETIVANELNRLSPDYDLIVSSLYAGHPTVRFIAPDVSNYRQWTANDRLPLLSDSGRGVALLLDPLLVASYSEARRFYPNAGFREFKPPLGGSPTVYEAQLAPSTLHSVQGLVARYYRGIAFEGTPVKEEALPALNLDWTSAPPVGGPFSAEFQGTLYVPTFGNYNFELRGASEGQVYVDENLLGSAPLQLAKGNHSLRARVSGATARFALWWQGATSAQPQVVPAALLFHAPVSNNGLLGSYFTNAEWKGAPTFTQVDPEIALYFHNIPLPRPYSVEWKGKVYAPAAGAYQFATESLDDSQVLINSRMIISNPGHNSTVEGMTTLAQGWNDIIVRFADKTSHTHIYLYWVPPGGAREIVPSQYLLPPMGRYPSAEEMAAVQRTLPLPEAPADGGARASHPTPAPIEALTLAPQRVIGEPGSGPAQFNEPHAVAVGQNGKIFVADTGNKRLQMLDPNGAFLGALSGGDERFVEPFDVVASSMGEMIVLDSDEGWLYRFDQDGHSLGRIGGPSAQFYHPRGLSLDSNNSLYVADTGGSRVVKMSLDGQRLQVFGTKGTGKGQFVEPSAAISDADGYLFATDVPNRRVESFSADGKFLLDFAIPQAGAYNGPHIAFAPDGSLLVSAPELNKIQRYSRDGKLLGEWGGVGPSQLRLPTGIRASGSSLWIADTANHRIQQWEIR